MKEFNITEGNGEVIIHMDGDNSNYNVTYDLGQLVFESESRRYVISSDLGDQIIFPREDIVTAKKKYITENIKSLYRDTTPTNFGLGIDLSNVAPNSSHFTESIVVGGINELTPVVAPEGVNIYINDSLVPSGSTVTNGDTVKFEIFADEAYDTTNNFTMSIGDISKSINVHTEVGIGKNVTTGALWSSISGQNIVFSNGNRTVKDGQNSGDHGYAFALDNPVSSGKYYFEVVLDDFSDTFLYEIGHTLVGISDGTTHNVVSQGNASATNAVGDVFMIAVDMNAGTMHYGKNGTWINDPAGGSGTAKFTSIPSNIGPCVVFGGSAETWTYTLRTKASELEYANTIPTTYNKGLGITSNA